MKRGLFIVLVLCLLMTFGLRANLAVANVRTVGVSKDDWFKYSLVLNWSSNNPNATIPATMKPFAEVEWMLTTIEGLSSTNVTFQMLTHLKNGTEYTQESWVDVETGQGASPFAIAANLNQNDTLYTHAPYSAWKIQETIARTYPEGPRDTNHACNTTELDGTGFHEHNFVDWYWDRSTGIAVEEIISMQRYETGGSQMNISSVMTIIGSNVWTISDPMHTPEFPIWASMPLILIVLAIALAFYKRRLVKTPIR
jgi:hypothetical protein